MKQNRNQSPRKPGQRIGRFLFTGVLAWLGVVDSAYLAIRHGETGRGWGICTEEASCSSVLVSSYSTFLGIPLALLGLTFYSLLLVGDLAGLGLQRERIRRAFQVAIAALATLGVVFSGYLIYVQAMILESFCPFCVASAVLATLLCLLHGQAATRKAPFSPPRPWFAMSCGGFALASTSFLVVFVPSLSASESIQNRPIALVNGEEIYPTPSLEAEVYRLKKDWLDKEVRAKLLAKRANEENVGVPELLRRLATGIGLDPGSAQESLLKLDAYLQTGNEIEILLEAPRSPLGFLDKSLTRSKGRADAPVQLTVFSDFECSNCATLAEILERAIPRFGDGLAVHFRHFPLKQHEKGRRAAIAAECAADQGEFWRYHDLLFKRFPKLEVRDIIEVASEIGLDLEKFQDGLDSEEIAARIDRSVEEARAAGVHGTPAIYLNGFPIEVHNESELIARVESALPERY